MFEIAFTIIGVYFAICVICLVFAGAVGIIGYVGHGIGLFLTDADRMASQAINLLFHSLPKK